MIVRRMPARAAARRGFTLLEVLAVVSILVVLASLATFATVRTLENAKKNEAKLKAQKIEQAIRVLYTETGSYPNSLQDLIAAGANGAPPLEGGLAAITDPWNGQFQFNVTQDAAGSERVVVSTTARDGTPIQWPPQ